LKKVEETVVDYPIMASKKVCKGPLGKNGQEWTERQKRLIQYIPTSKSHAEAAVKAGYPIKNAAQSAYQALQQMCGRVPDLMDQMGISERELIDKHLRRQLTAKRTVFVRIDRKFTVKHTVDDSQTQLRALHLAFLLHGSYAPRNPKEAAQFGVKVIIQDLGLLRGKNGRPPIDIKPGMAVPELPTRVNEGREALAMTSTVG
jgi:hypothetical protein